PEPTSNDPSPSFASRRSASSKKPAPRGASIAKKVEALLSRMTLEEKVGQMTQLNGLHGDHDELIRRGKVGAFLNVTDVESIARYQKIAAATRLGIPLLSGFDVVHR